MPVDSYSPLTKEIFGVPHSIFNLAELELSFGGQLWLLVLKLSRININ